MEITTLLPTVPLAQDLQAQAHLISLGGEMMHFPLTGEAEDHEEEEEEEEEEGSK